MISDRRPSVRPEESATEEPTPVALDPHNYVTFKDIIITPPKPAHTPLNQQWLAMQYNATLHSTITSSPILPHSSTDSTLTTDTETVSDVTTLTRELRRISQEVAYWKQQVQEEDTTASHRTEDTEDVELRWLQDHMNRSYHPSFLHDRESTYSEAAWINMYNYPSLSRSEFSINLLRSHSEARTSFTSSHTSSLHRLRTRGASSATSSRDRDRSFDEPRPLFRPRATEERASIDRDRSFDDPFLRPRATEQQLSTNPAHTFNDPVLHPHAEHHISTDATHILVSYNAMVERMESSVNVNITDSLASPSDTLQRRDEGYPTPGTTYEYFSQVWEYATGTMWSRAGTTGESVGEGVSCVVYEVVGVGVEGDVPGSHQQTESMNTAHQVPASSDHRIQHTGSHQQTEFNTSHRIQHPEVNPVPALSDLEAILDKLPVSRMDDQRGGDLAAIMARRRAATRGPSTSVVPMGGEMRPLGRLTRSDSVMSKESMLVKVLKRSLGMERKRREGV
ncbi:hypothetical protein BC829DRAFT_415262 [Chytridium lagenaria]|nr:hypothetical protein BC829DRAFT_415262 [Chytridium lagenaria]